MSTDTATVFRCSNCGSTSAFNVQSQTMRCPFCGTESVIPTAGGALPTLTAQQYVLPFAIDGQAAADRVVKWLGDSFFAPRGLASNAAVDRGLGTYIPFWRIDADAHSTWQGEYSETQTKETTRHVVGADGNKKQETTSEESKVWKPRSGTTSGHHRVWVCASMGLDATEADRLMPFPEEGLRTYAPELLTGFATEVPGLDEAGASVRGDEGLRESARKAAENDIERLSSIQTTLSNKAAALVYLPVWIYNYRFDGEQYRVVMNGATGEIHGKRPKSHLRVWLTVLAVVLVVIAIIVLLRIL